MLQQGMSGIVFDTPSRIMCFLMPRGLWFLHAGFIGTKVWRMCCLLVLRCLYSGGIEKTCLLWKIPHRSTSWFWMAYRMSSELLVRFSLLSIRVR